ncbi:MAG: type II toxin-antitoxin system HicA family toxin [Elusimicrobiota bacterium]
MKEAKLVELARTNPGGLRFSDLCRLAEAFGFVFQRQKGSHRLYAHEGLRQIMNFQNDRGTAKAYQVRQLLECVDRNQLTLGA